MMKFVHVGRLVIDTSENVHLSVLRGALVSCTIRLTDGSTIGVYYQMDLVQRMQMNKGLYCTNSALFTHDFCATCQCIQGVEDLFLSEFLLRLMHS